MAALGRLGRSTFRSRFRLDVHDAAYLEDRGLVEVMVHCRRMLAKRIGCAAPARDGRQTPMRGHPVFVAQHAVAACCRRCITRWHGIPAGKALSADEVAHLVALVGEWLEAEMRRAGLDQAAVPRQGRLF